VPLVSVITPTIPERSELLKECIASVEAQTYPHWEHVIVYDHDKAGCAKTMNEAARQAKGEWLLPLADDDLLLPGCIQALVLVAADADVVYPVPLVWGEAADQFCGKPPDIPSLALIRAESWRKIGGYGAGLKNREDNNLWMRMMGQSQRFVRYDQSPTWVYRFHGSNKSRA
jgi:glycosyltransferase involved in cell wall biosynthesis